MSIDKKEWDEQEFIHNLKQYEEVTNEDDLRKDFNLNFIETKTVQSLCSNKDKSSFAIPKLKGIIDNMYLKVYITVFDKSIIDELDNIYIQLSINNVFLSYTDIYTNLILSHLYDKSIKEYDDYILIPISILKLSFPKKIDLMSLMDNNLSIYIEHSRTLSDYQYELVFDYYEHVVRDIINIHITSYIINVLQMRRYRVAVFDRELCMHGDDYTLFLLFNESSKEYDNWNAPILNKVKIKTTQTSHIWLSQSNEITQVDLFGKRYHLISLISEFKSFENMNDIDANIAYTNILNGGEYSIKMYYDKHVNYNDIKITSIVITSIVMTQKRLYRNII
jgi:hypothetical protein